MGVCFRIWFFSWKVVSFTANTLSKRGNWQSPMSFVLPWTIMNRGFLDPIRVFVYP